MKARYVQRGESIDYTPTEDIAAGDVVVFGKIRGIAKLDIKAGTLGALALTGIYEMVKGDAAFSAGDIVGWDSGNQKIVAASTAGCTKIGYVVADAAGGDATVLVRLQQGLA
ncbi:MAG: DUF2190 family protein [Kiritimatiellia bacterium]